MNTTFVLPPSYSNHGRDGLLCRPAKFKDIASFFIFNYVAHVFTLTTEPGQSSTIGMLSALMALCFPTSGICRGLGCIFSSPSLLGRKSSLQTAARAGALCMVIRESDAPYVVRTQIEVLGSFVSQLYPAWFLPQQYSRPLTKWFASHASRVSWIASLIASSPHNKVPAGVHPMRTNSDIELGGDNDTPSRSPRIPAHSTIENHIDGSIAVSQDEVQSADMETSATARTFRVDFYTRIMSNQTYYPKIRVHGRCQLPKGYILVCVPPNAEFEGDDGVGLASSHNLVSIFVSIIQLIYACWTLYRSSGDQIDRWGYAAFSFTVVPYAFMSLVNLLGNASCPSYDCMYVVDSPCLRSLRQGLKEASESGDPAETDKDNVLLVDGIVGSVTEGTERDCLRILQDRFMTNPRAVSGQTILVFGSIPLAIIGALSSFKRASSTHAERVWTLLWLLIGIIVGPGVYLALSAVENRPFINSRHGSQYNPWSAVLGGLFYAAPAIGRFVLVGQMIKSYGVCEALSK